MKIKRRTVLLGLAGLSLPLMTASCTQSSQGSASNTAASPANNSGHLDRIRVGYQVYAGSELLAKGLGLSKQFFPNVKVDYLRFDAGRDVNVAMAANGIDIGLVGSTAAAVGISSGINY